MTPFMTPSATAPYWATYECYGCHGCWVYLQYGPPSPLLSFILESLVIATQYKPPFTGLSMHSGTAETFFRRLASFFSKWPYSGSLYPLSTVAAGFTLDNNDDEPERIIYGSCGWKDGGSPHAEHGHGLIAHTLNATVWKLPSNLSLSLRSTLDCKANITKKPLSPQQASCVRQADKALEHQEAYQVKASEPVKTIP